jgi:hypothetical protein
VFLFVCEVAVFIYRLQIFLDVKKKTYASAVGLSSIATSALFTAVAGILVLLTQTGDTLTCEITILTCIFLYTSTKFQLYLFFIERMHVVHRNPSKTRVQSPLYILNMCLLVPYFAILVLMVIYRVSYIDDNNDCRIGLLDASTLPLIVYDTIFSVYSVGIFVWPLCKSGSLTGSEKLLKVAKKNAIGTFISTISSFLNIFAIYWQNGLFAESCLAYCTVDVMVNVLVMNYLISGGGKKKHSDGTYTQQQTSEAESSYQEKSISSIRVHPINPVNPVRLVSQTCLTECLVEDDLAATEQKMLTPR